MYRLMFDPSLGKWVIKIQYYWVFWVRVADQFFDTYEEAMSYVTKVGLNKAYSSYQVMRQQEINRQPMWVIPYTKEE